MKMRIGFNADGILQFTAVGIRYDLQLAKPASLTEISSNMLTKNNALLKEYQVKSVDATLNSVGANLDSDAFPDGEKIAIDKESTFIKILCEASGVVVSFLKTTEIEQPVYLQDRANPIKAPPIATGTVEAASRVVTDVTSAVIMIYDLFTDEEARKEAIDGFIAIGEQIKDDPTTLFGLLVDVVIEEATGLDRENYNELMVNVTNNGRKHHLTTKAAVRTTATVFFSGKLIANLPKISLEVATKITKAKFFRKFDGLGDISDFKKRIKALPDGGEKILDDFKDLADGESLQKIINTPEFVDNWKLLDDSGVDESIRKNVTAVTDPDAVSDAIAEIATSAKPTWPEIKALWKRGNDFNRKAERKYDFYEIHLGNGKRLDSYIPGKEIVSRKATTLKNIKESTFEGYLKELTTKYKKGNRINSTKYRDKFGDNSVLEGEYFLEIPTSNRAYLKSDAGKKFRDLLKKHSAEIKHSVKIKYLDE